MKLALIHLWPSKQLLQEYWYNWYSANRGNRERQDRQTQQEKKKMHTDCNLSFSENSDLIERQETGPQGTGSVVSQVNIVI